HRRLPPNRLSPLVPVSHPVSALTSEGVGDATLRRHRPDTNCPVVVMTTPTTGGERRPARRRYGSRSPTSPSRPSRRAASRPGARDGPATAAGCRATSSVSLTQDSFFSQKARDAGYRLLCDTSVRSKHIDRNTGEVFE